jgi:hypothetical protein
VTSSNRPTCGKARADLITRRNADTCGDIDRWLAELEQGDHHAETATHSRP